MRVIDAHVHLWDVDVVPLPWFREDLGLPRRALPETLGALLSASGVSAAVAVQAADSVAEAEWLTEIAVAHPLVRRAVLQYEPAPDLPLGRTAAMLAPAARHPGAPAVAGLRAAVPQFAADLSDVAGLDALATAAGEAGLVLELLLRPEQLPGAAALAHRHPATTFVVCHLGLGTADPGAAWFRDLAVVAAEPNAHAKTSGLVHPGRGPAELGRLLAAAVDAFGPDRLLHGSDWPISARHTPYAEVTARIADTLPPLSSADAAALWSGTATRLYRL
jgi:L-fuconolactonase